MEICNHMYHFGSWYRDLTMHTILDPDIYHFPSRPPHCSQEPPCDRHRPRLHQRVLVVTRLRRWRPHQVVRRREEGLWPHSVADGWNLRTRRHQLQSTQTHRGNWVLCPCCGWELSRHWWLCRTQRGRGSQTALWYVPTSHSLCWLNM